MRSGLRPQQFLALFIALSLLSGITIGMNKILLSLLAIDLQLAAWQIGIISGAESFAMALATLPAGAVLALYSPRRLYLAVSLILTIIFIALVHIEHWPLIAVLMAVAGVCIAFRIVAMSSSFLQRLAQMGQHRAGWYKGSLFLGVMVLGPLLGNTLAGQFTVNPSFYVSAFLFLLLALLGLLVLPQAQAPSSSGRGQQLLAFDTWLSDLWRNRQVREACLFEGYGSAIAAFFGAFIVLIVVRDQHWPSLHGVWLLIAYGISYVSILFGAGRLLERFSVAAFYELSHSLVVLGLLLLTLATDFYQWCAAAILIGAGLGFNNLINMTRVAKAPVNKAHVSGLLTLGQMLGGTLGAVLGGYAGSILGLQHIFALLALPWLIRISLSAYRAARA